jgi:hypothetical protein
MTTLVGNLQTWTSTPRIIERGGGVATWCAAKLTWCSLVPNHVCPTTIVTFTTAFLDRPWARCFADNHVNRWQVESVDHATFMLRDRIVPTEIRNDSGTRGNSNTFRRLLRGHGDPRPSSAICGGTPCNGHGGTRNGLL